MSEDTALPLVDYGKFRLSLKRLEEQVANYGSAEVRRSRLDQEGVAESVVRRFRACYDCLWKTLRRHLTCQIGLPDVPNGPKPTFRLADQNGLFRASLDQWMLYADTRIDISRDHDGERAKACLGVVANFIGDAADLHAMMSRETVSADPARMSELGVAWQGTHTPSVPRRGRRNAT